MVHELQRQAYLSALGIENYMPRMILPFAPPSSVCELPVFAELHEAPSQQDKLPPIPVVAAEVTSQANTTRNSVANDILADVAPAKKSPVPVNAASILEQLEAK